MPPRITRQNLPLDLIALRRNAEGGGYAAPSDIDPLAKLPPNMGMGEGGPLDKTFALNWKQLETLLLASWRQGRLIVQPFIATSAAPIIVRPQEPRFYLFIQNQSVVNQLSVNFGRPAGALGIVPVNGIIIAPNFGFYEPLMVPQDEISIIASGVGTPGIVIYSTLPG